jgi:hypothetical protein
MCLCRSMRTCMINCEAYCYCGQARSDDGRDKQVCGHMCRCASGGECAMARSQVLCACVHQLHSRVCLRAHVHEWARASGVHATYTQRELLLAYGGGEVASMHNCFISPGTKSHDTSGCGPLTYRPPPPTPPPRNRSKRSGPPWLCAVLAKSTAITQDGARHHSTANDGVMAHDQEMLYIGSSARTLLGQSIGETAADATDTLGVVQVGSSVTQPQ